MGKRFLGAGILLALTAACGVVDEPYEDPFEPARLQARLHELLPRVEKVLGRPLGGPDVAVGVLPREVVSQRNVMARLKAAERRGARVNKTLYIKTLFYDHTWYELVDVAPGSNRIDLVAEAFSPFEDGEMATIVDLALVQGLIYVHQDRRYGPEIRRTTSSSEEENVARQALVRGHAEHISRLVARSLGFAEALERVAAEERRDDADLFQDRVTPRFLRKGGERFIREVLARDGPDSIDSIFRNPPRSTAEIAHPSSYPRRSNPSRAVDAALLRLQRLSQWTAAGLSATLREFAREAGAPGLVESLRHLVRASRFRMRGGVTGSAGFLLAMEYTSEEAARRAVSDSAPGILARYLGREVLSRSEIPETGSILVVSHTRSRSHGRRTYSTVLRRGRLVVELGDHAWSQSETEFRFLARWIHHLLTPSGGEAWRTAEATAEDPGSLGVLDNTSRTEDVSLRLCSLVALSGRWHLPKLRRTWRAALRDENPIIRFACASLSRADPRIPLTDAEALKNEPSTAVRIAVAKSLGERTGPGAAALLRTLTSDPAPEVRAVALQGLKGLRETEDLLPIALRLREDSNPRVRAAAYGALRQVDWEETASPEEAEALTREEHPEARPAALSLFRACHKVSNRRKDEVLLAAFVDPDPDVRRAAWSKVGTEAPPGLRASHALHMLPHLETKERLSVALWITGRPLMRFFRSRTNPPPALDPAARRRVIAALLRDPDLHVRSMTLTSMFRMCFDADDRALTLREALRAIEDPAMRSRLVGHVTLGDWEWFPPELARKLLKRRPERVWALMMFAHLRSRATAILPQLHRWATHPDGSTRAAVHFVRYRLGMPVDPGMWDDIWTHSQPHRLKILSVVQKGKDRALARRLLGRALTDPVEGVRSSALLSVALKPASYGEFRPQVVRALDDPAEYVRGQAAEALVALGSLQDAERDRIVALLSDPEKHARSGAAGAIRNAEDQMSRFEGAVPDLVAAIEREPRGNGFTLDLYFDALAALGKVAPDAPVELQKMLADEELTERAQAALDEIKDDD